MPSPIGKKYSPTKNATPVAFKKKAANLSTQKANLKTFEKPSSSNSSFAQLPSKLSSAKRVRPSRAKATTLASNQSFTKRERTKKHSYLYNSVHKKGLATPKQTTPDSNLKVRTWRTKPNQTSLTKKRKRGSVALQGSFKKDQTMNKLTITQDILQVAQDKSIDEVHKYSRINEILKQLVDEREPTPEPLLDGFGIKEEEGEERLFRESLKGSRALLGDITAKVMNEEQPKKFMYEPQLFSLRQIKRWEERSGKRW